MGRETPAKGAREEKPGQPVPPGHNAPFYAPGVSSS